MTTPAGWYPDPTQVDTQRYWDGEQWTDQRAPLAPAVHAKAASGDPKVRQALGLMALGLLGVILLFWAAALNVEGTEDSSNSFGQVIAMPGALLVLVGIIGLVRLAAALLSTKND